MCIPSKNTEFSNMPHEKHHVCLVHGGSHGSLPGAFPAPAPALAAAGGSGCSGFSGCSGRGGKRHGSCWFILVSYDFLLIYV